MIDFRLRNNISPNELRQKVGKILTPQDANLLLTGASRVYKPNGQLLAVYLPGVLKTELDAAYPLLSKIRIATENRGQASGVKRVTVARAVGRLQQPRTRAKPVHSGLLGAFEATGHHRYCRLTAYTARQTEAWHELRPAFQAIAAQFASVVPDRYAAQMAMVRRTNPAWVIPDTPFTTITVNNTWPTGVHTDKGDLDAGFSCLATIRRGAYTGGRLTFPEYRVAVDMQDGDLLLMDAHDWHGNTRMVCACGNDLDRACPDCDAERISLVCYFRTEMPDCGSPSEEADRRLAYQADTAVIPDQDAVQQVS